MPAPTWLCPSCDEEQTVTVKACRLCGRLLIHTLTAFDRAFLKTLRIDGESQDGWDQARGVQ